MGKICWQCRVCRKDPSARTASRHTFLDRNDCRRERVNVLGEISALDIESGLFVASNSAVRSVGSSLSVGGRRQGGNLRF